MKTLITTFAFVTLLFTAQAWAAHDGHNHEGQTAEASGVAGVEGAACENTVNVKVNGMVCDFCARALEKVFGKREEVSGIKVDLDNSQVTVAMKPGKTIDDATLTKLITDSGYDVQTIDKGC